jgi:hypothetical protein
MIVPDQHHFQHSSARLRISTMPMNVCARDAFAFGKFRHQTNPAVTAMERAPAGGRARALLPRD